MLIRKRPSWALKEADATSETAYLNRRAILKGMGITGGAVAGAAGLMPEIAQAAETPAQPTGKPLTFKKTDFGKDLTQTPYANITTYNNFYEFVDFGSFNPDVYGDPARNAGALKTDPWSVEVSGECMKPGTYSFEDLIRPEEQEERIYRHRCVEAWSMVVPWVGVPLANIIKRLEPTANAKFVRFTTYLDRKIMVGTKSSVIDWPYEEGLRMDEAMHPLTLVGTGLYGHAMPNQDGAPLRIVVPWKYGFKSVKSIATISFVEKQPPTAWNKEAPSEYGFYSNVNPKHDHPRWSQATERFIGGSSGGLFGLFKRQETLMFNGYAEQVAGLYKGMDLDRYF